MERFALTAMEGDAAGREDDGDADEDEVDGDKDEST